MIQTNKITISNELNKKINNWEHYSEIMYGYSKNEAIIFLKRFQVGIYDSIIKESLWFTFPINIDNLINYEKDRCKYSIFSNISEENFAIYSIIHSIKEHLEKIEEYPTVYNKNYHTKLNNYIQKPPTKKTKKDFEKLYIATLKKNFTWQEARAIITDYNNFNLTENKDFPENIKELQKIFNPKIITYYPKFFKKATHLLDITLLDKKINQLKSDLNKHNIKEYLNQENDNILDNYIIKSIKNIHTTNLNLIHKLFNSLITKKSIIDLNPLLKSLPEKEKISIQKHYNFIYQNLNELEYIEETAKILKNLIKKFPKTKEKYFNIILIFNTILSSKKIVPPIITKETLKLKEDELIKIIFKETLN